MTIQERAVGSVVVLDLDGKLILGEGAGLLKDKVRSAIFQGHRNILLNLAGVSYMDSSGLGEVIAAYTTVTRQGGTIKVVNLTKRVSDLLAISKVLTVFDVFEAEDEAIKSFPAAV